MVDLSDAVRGRASIWSVDGLNGERTSAEDLLEHVGLLEEIPSDSICEWEEGKGLLPLGSLVFGRSGQHRCCCCCCCLVCFVCLRLYLYVVVPMVAKGCRVHVLKGDQSRGVPLVREDFTGCSREIGCILLDRMRGRVQSFVARAFSRDCYVVSTSALISVVSGHGSPGDDDDGDDYRTATR